MTQISNNVTGIYFKQLAQNKTNSASNVPVDTSQYARDNLIKQYLDNLALQNKPQILGDNSKPIFTPTGIGDYENMLVKDATGKVVQEVKYTKEGNKIVETVNVNSVDGSTLNKVITQDGNKKTMSINVKDKNGNDLINENRTYEKIDEDNAISTHNGQEYKISGLKGNVITVEHNGEKKVIDFEKMVNPETEKLDQSKTGNTITNEQKDFLISRLKNRSGDILLTIDKELDKLTFMDEKGYEGWYVGYQDSTERTLKTCAEANNMLELHELGHGVNEFNDKSGKCWSDVNQEYHSVRDKEIEIFNQTNKSSDYKQYMQKFMNGEHMLSRGFSKEECKLVGANEEFAEAYGFFNNMDIENVNFKTTSLVQHMPESVRMVHSQIS